MSLRIYFAHPLQPSSLLWNQRSAIASTMCRSMLWAAPHERAGTSEKNVPEVFIPAEHAAFRRHAGSPEDLAALNRATTFPG